MNDAFAAQNLLRFAEVIANVGLGADPIDVALDAVLEPDLWLVTGCANLGRVAGDCVTHDRPRSPGSVRLAAGLSLSPAMAHFTSGRPLDERAQARSFHTGIGKGRPGLFAPRGSRNLAFF